MFSFGVAVAVLSFEPFALVDKLRENQRILDRIEHLSFVEEIVIRVGAAAEQIGQYFSSPQFGQNPCSQVVSRAVDGHNFYFRILLSKFVQKNLRTVAADVKVETSFLLGCCNDFVPFRLPPGLWLRGM